MEKFKTYSTVAGGDCLRIDLHKKCKFPKQERSAGDGEFSLPDHGEALEKVEYDEAGPVSRGILPYGKEERRTAASGHEPNTG